MHHDSGHPGAVAARERLSGVGSWRLDDGVLTCSEQMLSMLACDGVARPVDTVEALLELVHPDDRASLGAFLDAPAGAFEVRARFIRDGRQRWLLLRGEPCAGSCGGPDSDESEESEESEESDDNSGQTVWGVVLDVDGQSAAEAEADTRRRLDTLLRGLVEATIDAPGPDDLVSAVTALGVRDTTRWTYAVSYEVEQDLSLRLHTACGDGPAPDRTPCAASALDAMREGQTVWSHDDSRYAFPVYAEGDVAFVLVLERAAGPVSRPQADLMAERVNELLGWALERHRTLEALHAARGEAMRASAAKSMFLATVSHEVRAPLQATLEATDRALGTDLSLAQRELLQAASDSGRSLMRLLDDVLDLSAVEAGQLRLHAADLDVRDLCDDVCVHLAALAAHRASTVMVLVDPDVPTRLRGDADRLAQIVTNLVARALSVTADGSVLLRIASTSEGRRTRLTIEVTDDGPQLEGADLAGLFEPFRPSSQGTPAPAVDTRGGTGLGLAISRQLAAAMGGGIHAASGAEGGMVLTAELLLEPPRGARTDPADDALRARIADRGALVVSDDDHVIDTVGQMLRSWGARLMATDTASAPDLMRGAVDGEDPFEVVVWDVATDDLGDDAPLGGFIAWCANEISDPRHLPGAGEAIVVERPLTRRGLRAALLRSDGVVDPGAGIDAATPAQSAVVGAPKPGASRRPSASAPSATSGEATQVLLVEDNPVNHLVARRMLEELGCHVDVAEDGARGVAHFDPDRHDLVLMDLRMPVLDGVGATAAMREKTPHGRRTPIVAMTSAGFEADRAIAMEAGMDDAVSKPFSADDLRRMVTRWTGSRDTSPPKGEPAA